jgi:hypothetical protein
MTRICLWYGVYYRAPVDVQNGGSARGYHELRTSLTA